MAVSARRQADPYWVAEHISPLMATTIQYAAWYKATYFRVDPMLRRTVWALRRWNLTRHDTTLHCDVLTPFGEQVRRVLRQQRGM
jgi:hypothetical protein